MADRETIFFLSGMEPSESESDRTPGAGVVSLDAAVKGRIPKRTLPHHQPPGTRKQISSFDVQGQKGRVLYRDIEYIRKSGNSVLVFTMKEMYRIPVPMTEVERELAGVEERFLRVHRDYLINGRYLSWLWNQEVGLMDGTRIPVSRIYRTRVERVVAENRKKIVG